MEPIEPMKLRGLPDLTEARKHIQRINFEARQNPDYMAEAGQKISAIHHHLDNLMNHGYTINHFKAQNSLDAALSAHDKGDYRTALEHVNAAQSLVKAGDHTLYSAGGTKERGATKFGGVKRTPEHVEALSKFHGSVADYHQSVIPAKLADTQHTRERGVISVMVAPEYVATTNPTYAKQREKDLKKYANKKALKETK